MKILVYGEVLFDVYPDKADISEVICNKYPNVKIVIITLGSSCFYAVDCRNGLKYY